MGAEQGKIIIDGDLHISVRRSAQARRMTLRVARASGAIVLTLPRAVSIAEGQAFAQSRADWLRKARQAVPQLSQVAFGALLPVAGEGVTITPSAGRLVRLEGGQLMVPQSRPAGPVVAAWLKQLARDKIAAACDRHAQKLGLPYTALTLRDTRSRWGSCTHDGRLMFSWRLAMAPDDVLDYVAAHEVAHLRHMDHSAAFWTCCGALKPGYSHHRDWLRRHGHELLAWQFNA